MAIFLYQWLYLVLLPFTMVTKIAEANAVPARAKHPFYIAVTEISHNAATKSLEISCKFFVEDFEQTVEKNYKTQLDITAVKDKASFDKYIPDYISKHLSILVDGKTVVLKYIGFEKEKESVYAYFEVSVAAAPKAMNLTNSLLHDFIDQQMNIMHVMVGGKRQSTKLNYPETKAGFVF